MGITATQLTQRRLSQYDRSRVPHLFYDESVFVRVEVVEQHRSQGCRHSLGIDLVLQDHRDSMQWTDRTGTPVGVVQTIRFGERRRADGDDRIDSRPGFVQGVDAIDIRLDQLAARQLAGFKSTWMLSIVASRI